MIIRDKEKLDQYTEEYRLWQGVASVEVTKSGRIFATWYSGSRGERIGNFSFVVKSDDGGKTFSKPLVAAYLDEHRCFDPCLWIDPLDRLWFTWNIMPNDSAYASICANPDADELQWSDSFKIGEDIIMNKPTVLSTGEWLFPVAVWLRDMRQIYGIPFDKNKIPGAYVYKTVDNGLTFERLGGADMPVRDFDEHMIIEKKDGVLANYIRKSGGIGVSYSYDRGKTWTPGVETGMGETASRFHIRRLKSGRLLLITHKDSKYKSTKRCNLTAFLSEDDGETWKYSLMLDERDWVSYPDAKEADDGYIYIIYDRERGGHSLESTYARAREILLSKITEDDIIKGEISEKSTLGMVVSKLGKYAYENTNPYEETDRYSDIELADMLIKKYADCVVEKIFEFYPGNCINMNEKENAKLDMLIDALKKNNSDKTEVVLEMISLVRSASYKDKNDKQPMVNAIKDIIMKSPELNISTAEIANKLGVSRYYMLHQFKSITGTTIVSYQQELKILWAKRLLVDSDLSITEIAHKCGFGSSSYFSKIFLQSEKLKPSEYRKNLKYDNKMLDKFSS